MKTVPKSRYALMKSLRERIVDAADGTENDRKNMQKDMQRLFPS